MTEAASCPGALSSRERINQELKPEIWSQLCHGGTFSNILSLSEPQFPHQRTELNHQGLFWLLCGVGLPCSQTLCPCPQLGPPWLLRRFTSSPGSGLGQEDCMAQLPTQGSARGVSHPVLTFVPSPPPYLSAQLSFQPILLWGPHPKERN